MHNKVIIHKQILNHYGPLTDIFERLQNKDTGDIPLKDRYK